MSLKYADIMSRADDDMSEQAKVHFNLIKSLYLHRNSLWFGFFAQIIATMIVYSETSDREFIVCGIIHSLIAAIRFLDMRIYDAMEISRQERAAPREVSILETRYIIGSALQSLSFGFQAGYANFYYPGSTAAIVMVGIVLASLTSVAGRNFGSSRNVNIIILCACAPLLLALTISDNIYLKMSSVLVVAAMISCRQFATNVRSFLDGMIKSSLKVQRLANRFDSALQHMPNGLIMTDSSGGIVVMNPRAMKILGIRPEFNYASRSFASLMRLGMRNKRWAPMQKQQFQSQISALIDGRTAKELMCFANGTAIEVSISGRFNELGERIGSVMIFDDVSSRIQAQEKVEFLAHHDNMTSLPNRHHFSNLLNAALDNMRPEQRMAFCLFDIDRFKLINDTLGHGVGDKVIINIARRMSQIDDPRVICARIGGDEFVLVFHSLETTDDVTELFDAAFGSICSPSQIDGKVMNVRCSGGVSVYTKQDFKLEEAFVRSDIALYQSKKTPEIIWTYFDNAMEEEFRKTQETKQDLRKAVAEGAVRSVYQPMYTPDGKRIECCEALARWQHPTLGRISPAVFIEMAEGMRVIGDITRQMLLTACEDCMTWPRHISVSVNLSALDLLHDDIINLIQNALEATGLEPHRLQVEVTESALAANRIGMAKRLHSLREIGVKTALDDFGTGYSSLSYLSDLPLDKVKIDRSFVTRIVKEERARTLFNAVVNLSRELGFEIVVEGVEGTDQLELIRKLQGVDLIQGFIFGPPKPSEQIAQTPEAIHAAPANALMPRQLTQCVA
jgi:PAS domain S-box/diguanylate cyclase (GGDEF) domain